MILAVTGVTPIAFPSSAIKTVHSAPLLLGLVFPSVSTLLISLLASLSSLSFSLYDRRPKLRNPLPPRRRPDQSPIIRAAAPHSCEVQIIAAFGSTPLGAPAYFGFWPTPGIFIFE